MGEIPVQAGMQTKAPSRMDVSGGQWVGRVLCSTCGFQGQVAGRAGDDNSIWFSCPECTRNKEPRT